MTTQYQVATQELGVIYRSGQQWDAEDFGRWFRDRNALAVTIKDDVSDETVTSYPVNG